MRILSTGVFCLQFHPKLDALYKQALPCPTSSSSSKLEGYHLALLGVLPSLQGKGIGRRLVQEVLEKVNDTLSYFFSVLKRGLYYILYSFSEILKYILYYGWCARTGILKARRRGVVVCLDTYTDRDVSF